MNTSHSRKTRSASQRGSDGSDAALVQFAEFAQFRGFEAMPGGDWRCHPFSSNGDAMGSIARTEGDGSWMVMPRKRKRMKMKRRN